MNTEDTSSIPHEFICPITQEIMQNPVLLIEDGHSYELEAIEQWLTDHNTSPITNQSLNDRRFVNNFNLKNTIEQYCAQQSTFISSNQFLTFNIHYNRTPHIWKTKPTLTIRLSLLGSSNTGKTTVARYLQYGSQLSFLNLSSTVTVAPDLNFFYLDQLYEDKYVIVIQLADIPGMERYESCCDSHFRNCHGALIVVDSTDIETVERAERYWHRQLQLKGREYVEIILVCNKIDLFKRYYDDNYRRVFLERIEKFASSNNISIHYISALTGENIQSMFKQFIIKILHNKSLLEQIIENSSINEKPPIRLKRLRRTLPSNNISMPSSSDQDNFDRNSSRHRCC